MTATAEKVDPPVTWELNGDQYELFPLPPGPSRMFRSLLGQPDPAPELMREPDPSDQYEIFPILGTALKPKEPPPPGMVDDGELGKLQEVLAPGADKLAGILASENDDAYFAAEPEPPPRVMPNFGDND